jgi:outer membrane cobalamin receptor
MISKKLASSVSSSSSIKFSNKFVRIGKMCEFNILQKTTNQKIEATNELMFGKTPVNKIVDFFDDEIEDDDDYDDLEIDTKAKSSYKMFKKLKLN